MCFNGCNDSPFHNTSFSPPWRRTREFREASKGVYCGPAIRVRRGSAVVGTRETTIGVGNAIGVSCDAAIGDGTAREVSCKAAVRDGTAREVSCKAAVGDGTAGEVSCGTATEVNCRPTKGVIS